LPVPEGPNYVTPHGLELLKKAVVALLQKKKDAAPDEDLRPINRDLRYLESRISSAIVVPPGSGVEIRFGANVTIEDESGSRRTFQIVGNDEARTGPGFLSWSAPLAIAMLGATQGQTITFDGENGTARYKVIKVAYPAANHP
jgi:transcription elongation factor GreB